MTKRYIIIFIVGVLFGLLFTCSRSSIPSEKTTTKIETKWKIKTTTDTISISYPEVRYVNRTLHTTSDTRTDIDSTYYDYTYQRSIYGQDNRFRIDVKVEGWGNIKNMDYTIIEADSTAYITETTTIEKTIVKNAGGLFLSGEYIRPISLNQATYRVNLDIVHGNVIIGGSAGYNSNTKQPEVGIKLGIKLN
ncbi:hypothetical protein ACFPVY_04000 [Flavobacterium qiangtangense]|uniref:Lipoprotein n=1 Tax=Flavobacterium qiangtangense TaxID=1442595 RepID=A0ABW1PJP9_9FLAO